MPTPTVSVIDFVAITERPVTAESANAALKAAGVAANTEVLSQVTTEQFTQPVAGSYGSIRNTMVHMLSAEWGWLERCGGAARGAHAELDGERAPSRGARRSLRERAPAFRKRPSRERGTGSPWPPCTVYNLADAGKAGWSGVSRCAGGSAV